MKHRVEIAEALSEAQFAPGEWIIGAQNLTHPTGPADALTDVAGEAFGGQAGRLGNVDVGGVPSANLHAQRRGGVFGDGLGGEALDFLDGGAAQHRARAAEEGGVPKIVAVLNQTV